MVEPEQMPGEIFQDGDVEEIVQAIEEAHEQSGGVGACGWLLLQGGEGRVRGPVGSNNTVVICCRNCHFFFGCAVLV